MNMTAPDSLPSARGHAQSRRVELLWLLALLIALAFAFQGSRGLWGTDEGRYTNVALRMLNSGDYLFPSLNDEEPHFSKPPLTYWAIAESVRLLGRNEWAARLPNALAFIGTGLLMYGLGLRLTPGRPWLPALIYVTSLGPFVAANVITTDTLLTLWETLAVFAFVAAWFSDDAQRRRRYLLLMWCGFGLAFATKGPPGLLPLLPIAVLRWSYPSSSPPVVSWPGLAAFVVIGFSWFAAVIWARPELLGYFLGYEVYDRLFTSVQDRNPQWYGALQTYGMAFLIGTLPWLILMIRPLMQSWRLVTPRFWRERRDRDPAVFFLLLWLLLPLAVFCVAQSRLLLYVLPLFAPIALLLATRLQSQAWVTTRWAMAAVGLTVVLLLGIKWGATIYPYHRDAREPARLIAASLPGDKVKEVVYLDYWPQYGLSLYLNAAVEEASLSPPGHWCGELWEPGLHVFVAPKEYVKEVHRQANACGRYVIYKRFDWQELVFMTISAPSAG